MVRARALGARGRWFESSRPDGHRFRRQSLPSQRLRMMRARTLTTPIAFFCLGFLIAGCPPAQRVDQTDTTQAARPAPESPDEQGLRAFLQKAIAKANQEAAELDGQTFVEHCAFKRSIYFIPKPPPPKQEPVRVEVRDGNMVLVVPPSRPPPPLKIPEPVLSHMPNQPQPPPKGAVGKHWVDRYAMAQQFSYRYSLESVGAIVKGQGESEAESAPVRIKLTARRRTAIAGDEKPIPEPPKGMKVWYPSPPWSFGSFGGGGTVRELKKIEMPPQAHREIKGPLAEEAVKKMQAVPEEVVAKTMNMTAHYSPEWQLWFISWYWSSEMPEPVRLWQKHIPRGKGVQSIETTGPSD